MGSGKFRVEGKSTSDPDRPRTYSDRCCQAIARALPLGDDWQNSFMDPGNETLETLTSLDDFIPAICATGRIWGTQWVRDLGKSKNQSGISDLAKIWASTNVAYQNAEPTLWGQHKPVAVFTRTEGPSGVHIVMHQMCRYRSWHDSAVITTLGHPNFGHIMVERRTTFCALLVRCGPWAERRPNRVVAIDWDSPDYDLRKVDPGQRYELALLLARSWNYQRSRTKMFRDLSDTAFIKEVMDIQQARFLQEGYEW